MLRRLIAFTLVLPLVAGCALLGDSSTDRVLASYEPEGPTQVVQAPREATYSLYQHTAPDEVSTKGPENVRAQVQVASGKPIGFEKSETGELRAVAGEEKFSLPEGDYWWRLSTPPPSIPKKLNAKFEVVADEAAKPVSAVASAAKPIFYLCLAPIALPLVLLSHLIER